MTPARQRNLAIAAAVAVAAAFLAANAHLVTVAVRSQPACVATDAGPAPARRAC
jgi:hypothetical protein